MQSHTLTIAINQQTTSIYYPDVAGLGTPHSSVATLSRSPSAAITPNTVTPSRTPNNLSPNVSPARRHAQLLQLQQHWGSAPLCGGPAAPLRVSVVAPGGGTGINSAVYAELGQDPRFHVQVVGQSRAPYDCYPPEWPHGGPPPNLASFAEDVFHQKWPESSDLFVFGSRGGQVVLPALWQRLGDRMPPSVVINGGCAMNLPRRVAWPEAAVTFLLIGGQDNFRGNLSIEEYVAETRAWVPEGNKTTGILYVEEMGHMPQASLLRTVLPLMLCALQSWRSWGGAPKEEFRQILAAVNQSGWSGRLMYTRQPGQWAPDVDFGPFHVARHIVTAEEAAVAAAVDPWEGVPVELSRKDELKALFRAAALAAKPSGGAPLASSGARFHAAAQAAAAAHVLSAKRPGQGAVVSPPKRLAPRPLLPIPAAGACSMGGFDGSPTAAGGSRTPNRLQVPRAVRVAHCDPTPISKALGMGRFGATPGHSEFNSPVKEGPKSAHSAPQTPPHYFGDASPVRVEW